MAVMHPFAGALVSTTNISHLAMGGMLHCITLRMKSLWTTTMHGTAWMAALPQTGSASTSPQLVAVPGEL
jgi:hypothetical protein